MKYENFDKAKQLFESIQKHEVIIEQLQYDDVSVRLHYGGNSIIMTIGTWETCEHSCKDMANDFKVQLIKHYSDRISKMKDELSFL